MLTGREKVIKVIECDELVLVLARLTIWVVSGLS